MIDADTQHDLSAGIFRLVLKKSKLNCWCDLLGKCEIVSLGNKTGLLLR